MSAPSQPRSVSSPLDASAAADAKKTATSSKLSVFIICRFEKLTSEDQNVLRSASIIGHEFSRDILYGILSPKMRTHVFSSLQSLIKNQWIVETKSQLAEYRFVHPLLYQTLYDLTPASDKGRLHYSIASYIEDAYEGNPSHFAQLGHHYGMSKDCRPKALEYFVRAAVQCAGSGIDFYDEMLDLVGQAGLYADSAFDYGAILGVVMDGREKVNATKKKMIIDEKIREKEKEQSELAANSKISEVSSTLVVAKIASPWQVFRNRLFGIVVPSNAGIEDPNGLAQSPNSTHGAAFLDIALVHCSMSVEALSELLERFDIVEVQLTEAFDEMVKENNVGTILEWQKPLLTKKREIMQSRGQVDESGNMPQPFTLIHPYP